MTLLAPLALALLVLIPPIIALYLLKLRRQERPVSSVYLWQRFVRDVEANAPWQRLRRNLLLLLQILLLLSLILALARPAARTNGPAGRVVVLVFDTSASMAAQDGAPGPGVTRLAAAQARARDLVANLPDSSRLTLITGAGGEAGILLSASQDRRQALAAIDSLQPTALDSDLGPALALAEAIVAREPEAEIVLLSDGAVQLPALTAPVRLLPFGRDESNQAVSALTLTPAAGGSLTLFVQAANYGARPAGRRLVVQVDGASFTAFDLALPGRGHAERLLETLPATAQTVTAFLEPAPDDLLALDDRAWAVARPGRPPARVILVTPGNAFLQTALGLLDGTAGPGVELTVMSPEDWRNDRAQNGNSAAGNGRNPAAPPASLHIFDAFMPDTLPPGNLLFIAPPAPALGLFEVLGQVASPVPQAADSDHPLLQNASLAGVQLLAATALAPGDWGRTVIAGADPAAAGAGPVPLLLAGEKDGRRVAVLAFDLHQSDLPLRPAFPILVANLVGYLAPTAGGRVPPELAPGQAFSLAVPAGTERVRLSTPEGEVTVRPDGRGRANLPPLARPGLYHLAFEPGGETAQLAVNFFDPPESAVTPRPDLALPDPGGGGPAPAPLPAYREWWRPLALAVLALLLAEWAVYQRGNLLQYGAAIRQKILGHRP